MSQASAKTAWEVEATNLTEYAVRRSQMGMQFSNPDRPVFFLGGCAVPLASARLDFFRNMRRNETVAECLAEYDDAVQCVLIELDGAFWRTFGVGY
jgi:hypothetical protein